MGGIQVHGSAIGSLIPDHGGAQDRVEDKRVAAELRATEADRSPGPGDPRAPASISIEQATKCSFTERDAELFIYEIGEVLFGTRGCNIVLKQCPTDL